MLGWWPDIATDVPAEYIKDHLIHFARVRPAPWVSCWRFSVWHNHPRHLKMPKSTRRTFDFPAVFRVTCYGQSRQSNHSPFVLSRIATKRLSTIQLEKSYNKHKHASRGSRQGTINMWPTSISRLRVSGLSYDLAPSDLVWGSRHLWGRWL